MIGGIATGMLAFVAAAVWLGCAGFARLRDPLDRLHCVTFVNTAGGIGIAALAFVVDGASSRALKVALLVVLNLLAGAVLSHATARALVQRAAAGDDDGARVT